MNEVWSLNIEVKAHNADKAYFLECIKNTLGRVLTETGTGKLPSITAGGGGGGWSSQSAPSMSYSIAVATPIQARIKALRDEADRLERDLPRVENK